MDWSLWANQTKYILWLQQCPLKRIELEELGDCHFWWQSQQKSRKGRSCYMTAITMWNGRSLETWCQWRIPGVITLLSSWDTGIWPKISEPEKYTSAITDASFRHCVGILPTVLWWCSRPTSRDTATLHSTPARRSLDWTILVVRFLLKNMTVCFNVDREASSRTRTFN